MTFQPTAPWDALKLRAELLARTRRFFDDRGFIEVETPILSADIVVDRHLEPFHTELEAGPLSKRLYLQTSPEFHMKRLLAAGAEAIYQITRAFRQGEIGRRHNPEFTIVEWYRVGDDYEAGMSLLSDLAEAYFARGRAERISYREAFEKFVGVDPLKAEIAELIAAGAAHGLVPPESFLSPSPLAGEGRGEGLESAVDRDTWLDWLLTELVEPNLGQHAPAILYDYPASQAALAKLREDDTAVAERCELYFRGVELANGYHELLDPAVLRERNRVNNQLRAADGKSTLPESSHLLDAMEYGLPPCMGVALGFDRVVMLAAGKSTLGEVVAFPIERA